jgi:hypothetical protein
MEVWVWQHIHANQQHGDPSVQGGGDDVHHVGAMLRQAQLVCCLRSQEQEGWLFPSDGSSNEIQLVKHLWFCWLFVSIAQIHVI